MKLILASGSPRRSEILKNAGYEFVVKPTSADESLPGGILPEDAVKLLSERKADAAMWYFPPIPWWLSEIEFSESRAIRPRHFRCCEACREKPTAYIRA